MEDSNENTGGIQADLGDDVAMDEVIKGRLETLTPADGPVTEVRLIVTGTDGEVYYTWGSVNPELASILAKHAMMPDWPVKKQPAKFMAIGRDLYRVTRDYLLSVIGTFCTSDYETVKDFGDSIPETALLTLEVVR